MNNINLTEIEKKAFRTTFQDGLVDIFIGLVLLQFPIILLINDFGLGDFWSSIVVTPIYLIGIIVIVLVKKHIIAPRSGFVKYGATREKKLIKLNFAMLFFLALGAIACFSFYSIHEKQPQWIFPILFSITALVSFSAGAYLLDIPRFYAYGFLVSMAIPIGELLYQHAGASHHGFPICFGVAGGIIITVGIVLFIQFLKRFPLPNEGESGDRDE